MEGQAWMRADVSSGGQGQRKVDGVWSHFGHGDEQVGGMGETVS